MARAAASFAAASSRLIRAMHAGRHVRELLIDRYGGGGRGGACSWFSAAMMMFQRRHEFGTMTSPPSSIECAGQADPKTYPVSVPVENAHKLHRAGHQYLDVRTRHEFDEGHASGAVNIPYLISTQGGMSRNPSFLEEVAAEFGKEDKIIVGCRSGKRSLMAVEELRSAGYSKATNIEGGYMAWPDKE